MTQTISIAGTRRRPAYTLIELIVVMGVILVLAGLLIVMWPGLGSSTQATRQADKIQGYLLIAKMRALRDGRPTGVRLVLSNPLDPYSPCKQLMYIQQPDDFMPTVTTTNGVTTIATLQPAQSQPGPPAQLVFTGVDFTGGQSIATDYLVQAAGGQVGNNASTLGDYLEVNGGGPLHPIIFVYPNQLIVRDSVALANPTTNWRVVRNPRPLAGEEPLDLSGTIIIDLAQTQSLNVPLRASYTDGTSPPVYYRDILFSPSGSVIGQGTSGNDKILLWVRDSSYANATQGEPVLVGIQIGTGFIGGYPVDINGVDPYSNAHDPHASGM